MTARIKKDLLALALTVPVNLGVMALVLYLPWHSYPEIYWGWGICPLYGGILRSLLAHRFDLIFIIPAMAVLDAFVFVPLISIADVYGVFEGLVTAAVMVAASLVTLGIRSLVVRLKKKKA